MRRIFVVIFLACLLSLSCYAIKSMMFNSIDQYIDRADGIWIVQVVKESGKNDRNRPTYQAKVLQTLKGDPDKKTLTVWGISRELTPGHRYLFFGFNRRSAGEAWLDNGNVSPIPLPPTFSFNELEGKSVKEQISSIMTARRRELKRLIKELTEEKATLEEGLEFQKRLDKLPSKGK